ncbi:MAG: Rab family GTPase [Promethearchaeota archaeon]
MVDYVLKIVLLGEGNVGKTSLVYRYIENRFSQDFKSTLGVNLLKKKVALEDEFAGKSASVQIWDLGGQSAYRKLRKLYLEGSQGALVVFDVTSQQSFDALEDWIQSLIEIRGNDVPMIIIGNKIDLASERVVTDEAAIEYGKKYNTDVIFTSAATGEKVEDSFRDLIMAIVRKISS